MGKEKHVGLENQPGRDAFSFNIRGTTFLVSVLPFSSKTLFVCMIADRRSIVDCTTGTCLRVSILCYWMGVKGERACVCERV